MIRKYEPSSSTTGAAVVQNISSQCLSEHDFTFYSDLDSTAEEVAFENVNPVDAISALQYKHHRQTQNAGSCMRPHYQARGIHPNGPRGHAQGHILRYDLSRNANIRNRRAKVLCRIIGSRSRRISQILVAHIICKCMHAGIAGNITFSRRSVCH